MGIRYSIGAAIAAVPLIVTGLSAVPANASPSAEQAVTASGTTTKTVCFNAKKHKSKVVTGSKCAGANWKPVANLGKKLAKVAASKKKHLLCVRNSSGQAKVVTTKKCPRGYKKYSAAQLGLVGPAGQTGPTGATGPSAPSSPQLEDPSMVGAGTAIVRIRNYDPNLTYSFSATPAASFGSVVACSTDPQEAEYGWGCVTVTGTPGQWVLVSVTASSAGVASTAGRLNLPLGQELPAAPVIMSAVPGMTDTVVTVSTPTSGGPVNYYQYRVNGGSWSWVDDFTGNQIIINEVLTSGEMLEIRAENDSGFGDPSTPFPIQ